MTKKAKKTKKDYAFVKAKRKCAVARAVVKKGNGKIIINKIPVENYNSKYLRMFITEPIVLAPIGKQFDYYIKVKGGGFMAQAIAARSAIAKAIVELTKDEKIKKEFIKYDRMLLVDDIRRVEPKKPLGPKARRKKQKSKR
ncbi:MAG: 30S ribosomal protein S9 [Candidatus Diapherotrites archaeon]|nr:30S ribosomal protein S9 [Candidatus Diapherotrites archaeon]